MIDELRLLVTCELRGWITYRLTPRPTGSLRRRAGDVLLGIDVFTNPGAATWSNCARRRCSSAKKTTKPGHNCAGWMC